MKDEAVHTVIQERLRSIEQKHNVNILLAIESGSRAWGFASPDSDWDVRFIYVHREPWYFKVHAGRDVIETGIEQHPLGELDINGWELRKSLQLLHKSNPALMEWLQSPLLYRRNDLVMSQYENLAKIFFKPQASFQHYVSMAITNAREFLQKDQVRLKKYLYVLRPIFACLWIEQFGDMPPIEFHRLLERLLPDGSLRAEIDALLIKKMAGGEMEVADQIPAISAFIHTELARLKQIQFQVAALDAEAYEACDLFLMETIKKNS
ncbi:nucleotidyltransferase domain-containing protein [Undibacterium flavidum]|uniref:Nucleotidyltransferase domain-containing protein n=1 Tax=Undibacterium flavidum TaxID=2762297 RepID=A0ABR6Y7Q6_9BURK|nr:nucleotidyltransferase domain-containing protein [Undibacterium flavidum]MBC3872645.1 nucleotidyltransferase domain-containing protein [Undibacterium flavidum]